MAIRGPHGANIHMLKWLAKLNQIRMANLFQIRRWSGVWEDGIPGNVTSFLPQTSFWPEQGNDDSLQVMMMIRGGGAARYLHCQSENREVYNGNAERLQKLRWQPHSTELCVMAKSSGLGESYNDNNSGDRLLCQTCGARVLRGLGHL